MRINIYYDSPEKPRSTANSPRENFRSVENPEAARDTLSEEVLGKISNKEFLNVSREQRLEVLTRPSVHPNTLTAGSEVNFRFSFDGKINKNLYLYTTAGQLLPSSVMEATLGDHKYIRDGMYGEFFTQDGKRLIIKDGTRIKIETIRTVEDMAKLEEAYKNEISSFGEFQDIALEAKRRGIDPQFMVDLIGDRVKQASPQERKTTIEYALADFGRAKGNSNMPNIVGNDGKYVPEIAIPLFVAYSSEWEKHARQYGIPENAISSYKSDGMTSMSLSEAEIDNGENLSGDSLWNHPPFYQKMQQVCARLGINENDLKLVMRKESGINPKAVNPNGGATGLIQFMPNTARGLGTTTGKLRMMSGVQQLDYVEKYYAPYKGKIQSAGDLYLATFYPYAAGKGDNFIVGSEKSASYARTVAIQNPAIARHSQDPSGITVEAFNRYVNA